MIDNSAIYDSLVGSHPHICAFFHSAEEKYRVLQSFISDGFERGERAFHIVGPQLRGEHRRRVEAFGIDVPAAEEKGQFEIRNWGETYLREGHFNQERMIELIQEVLDEGKLQGFSQTRLIAHMEWALEDRPGVENLIEYEAKMNYVLPKYQDPVICTYDLAKFRGDIVVDVMHTHPMVIVGGTLQENPFFVPPDQFLSELRERRANSRLQH